MQATVYVQCETLQPIVRTNPHIIQTVITCVEIKLVLVALCWSIALPTLNQAMYLPSI